MRYRPSADAQKKVCYKSLDYGSPFLCYGSDCMAWEIEPDSERKKHGDNIEPLGRCSLLEADTRDISLD